MKPPRCSSCSRPAVVIWRTITTLFLCSDHCAMLRDIETCSQKSGDARAFTAKHYEWMKSFDFPVCVSADPDEPTELEPLTKELLRELAVGEVMES